MSLLFQEYIVSAQSKMGEIIQYRTLLVFFRGMNLGVITSDDRIVLCREGPFGLL